MSALYRYLLLLHHWRRRRFGLRRRSRRSRRYRSTRLGRRPSPAARIGLVVQLHDVVGDVHRRGRPQHGRRLLIADIQNQGVAVLRGVLLDDRQHLVAQLVHQLALRLVQIGLGILGVAVQFRRKGVTVAHDLGSGFFAHGGAALLQLVLQRGNVLLLLLQFGLPGSIRSLKGAGGHPAIIGAQNRVLHTDNRDLGRRGGLSVRQRGEPQN